MNAIERAGLIATLPSSWNDQLQEPVNPRTALKRELWMNGVAVRELSPEDSAAGFIVRVVLTDPASVLAISKQPGERHSVDAFQQAAVQWRGEHSLGDFRYYPIGRPEQISVETATSILNENVAQNPHVAIALDFLVAQNVVDASVGDIS